MCERVCVCERERVNVREKVSGERVRGYEGGSERERRGETRERKKDSEGERHTQREDKVR